MSIRMYQSLQALILVLLALFLLNRFWSGTLFWYINVRFLPLTLLGAFGMLWLAQTILLFKRSEVRHSVKYEQAIQFQNAPPRSGWQLILLALPFVLGILIPAQPLGTSALIHKGLNTNPPRQLTAEGSLLTVDLLPQERTVLDWIRAFNTATNPDSLTGQPADVIGFVYNDPRLEEGQFLLGRFTLTCCVADAVAIGLIVDLPDKINIPDNTWVRVRGTVQPGFLERRLLPRIEAATIEEVPLPEQSYLYN